MRPAAAAWLPVCCLLLAACATSEGGGEAGAEDPGTIIGHWQLVEIRASDDRVHRPGPDARFAVSLLEGGSMTVTAHCNRALGRWRSEGPNQVRFGPLATTRAHCGPDSLHDRFMRELAAVRTFVLREGRLYLATRIDGAVLEFERVEPDS